MTSQEVKVHQELIDAITGMDEEGAVEIADRLLDEGVAPADVLDDCKAAMEVIGKRFEAGECFIPELIFAGDILSQIAGRVKPRMQEAGQAQERIGKVVIGTVQGDIHDIAKDIVAFMLDINGFEVTDLGVDVAPEAFVEAARGSGVTIVGLSGFLTLAYDPMKETVAQLRALDPGIRVMIGGGQMDDKVRDYTGADAYGKDALAAVALAKGWA
ncbi:MAG TPA: cobalamin-dependent protein [Candidatus Limnocylindrales bacterium]